MEAASAAAGIDLDTTPIEIEPYYEVSSVDPLEVFARTPLSLSRLETEIRRLAAAVGTDAFWVPYRQYAAILFETGGTETGLRARVVEFAAGEEPADVVLPEACRRRLPDLDLLRDGFPPARLHPLVRRPGLSLSFLIRRRKRSDLAFLAAADELGRRLGSPRMEPAANPQLEALALAVSANLPVLLWGEPGIGKSAGLRQLATGLGVPLETVIASAHEPSDFAGLPIIGDDPAATGVPMALPDWAVRLAASGRGIVFFDELSSAPPAVQAALLRVVLERRVGSLALPESVRVVAAANPPSSAVDGWHLSPPLANRFVHLRWAHDPRTVARGMAGTWPAVPVPVVDPRRGRPRPWDDLWVPHRPARPDPPPARRRGKPGRRGLAWPSPLGRSATPPAPSRKRSLPPHRRGRRRCGPGTAQLPGTARPSRSGPRPSRSGRLRAAGAGRPATPFLTAVVSAVQSDLTRRRWEAGWTVLAKAVEAGVPDVAARAAADLAALRDTDWPVPAGIDAFLDLLQLSGALPSGS
ncbi:MoxR family ATPase [Actinomadura sp. NAK00032]|uniref:AAA family ATPase n=1 Tax=Actinomadura sp. NAK00032 TaxID=2742128 RepID=UPI0020C7D56F|nr:MoxR family ATPase [Actinomadura sp. NAK00032]